MAICPFATWKPLPANSKQARMTPRLAIVHTAVDAPGETDLWGWFAQSGLEAHFFIQNDGDLLQYMDTNVVAEANYKANNFAVSIETEDDGAPRTTEWNAKQTATLVRLLDWLCTVHPTIPRRQADRWDGSGVGWHSMWGLNTKAQPGINPWTSALGKDCPTAPRIAQMRSTILPRLAGGTPPQEHDMQLTDKFYRWPHAGETGDQPMEVWKLFQYLESASRGVYEQFHGPGAPIPARLGAVETDNKALRAEVAALRKELAALPGLLRQALADAVVSVDVEVGGKAVQP
ncbi:N-acetylmuramoyl-L-alanine amidase [Actinokineospora globicatena]|uniref:N-acetylmuramoyl-L-alanine amidase domain-containing protein n=1 Tax=Actinokineospora globicatena TaxID=103729 RepID=A0A9W6QJV9_9PSEU|nr:N-acetylmuramoyl-L-alanine amidase [Actinokineospora globicatena]GLW91778.1 hypothetical protein Aglo03_25940 [Actinokineospora globicatena]